MGLVAFIFFKRLAFILCIGFTFGFYQRSESIFYDSALAVNPSTKEEFLNREM